MSDETEALRRKLLKNDGAASVAMLVEALSMFETFGQKMNARIAELTEHIKELQANPFAYDGPHEGGKTYPKGTFVTHDGSLWHCNYKTASRPGDGPAWTLSVKRGRDGKDLRNEK